MAKVDLKTVQKLRKETGLGMMDCKKALQETNSDYDKAIDLLRKKGAKVAAKRSGQETTEGLVHTYIHPGNRVGVMLELNCETDFVARTDNMKQFAQDICLHIAALKPFYLAPEDIDENFLKHERNLFKEQLLESGKPEKIIDQIVEGKVKKLESEVCLLKQSFVKNDQMTVEQALEELIGKTGESIKIKKFARFEIGA